MFQVSDPGLGSRRRSTTDVRTTNILRPRATASMGCTSLDFQEAMVDLAKSAFERIDTRAAVVAGLAAGAAFVATMEVDLRVTGRNVDDRILLGRRGATTPAKAKAPRP